MPKLSPGPGLSAREVAAHQLARIREAMVELVAKVGYRSLKVRDVIRTAEISSRTFYEHFGSKEDCFLETTELVFSYGVRRILAAQAGEQDWRKRLVLAFEEFVHMLEVEPEAARLALVEAYTASEASLAQARRTERAFQDMLAGLLACASDGSAVPEAIVEAAVAGIAAVARNRLLAEKVADLRGMDDELIGWVLDYTYPGAVGLAELDRQSVLSDATLEPVVDRAGLHPATGDEAFILTAVASLAVTDGYTKLTASRICAVAGVSREAFDSQFSGVEACYLLTLEQHVGAALAHADRSRAAARSEPGAFYRAIAALCDYSTGDPFLVRLCLTDDFPSSPAGARSRRRVTTAIAELFGNRDFRGDRTDRVAEEASTAAVWALFQNHVLRDGSLGRRIPATLAYLALTPTIGAAAALAAIKAEQGVD